MSAANLFADTLILTGPTGSGKSDLALALAERLGAEIVAMDSMTLYRGMDIGTAKPTIAEQARVRHHLLDELAPWEAGSVAWWLDRAAVCCREIEARGKQVLFVGGTPLYLKALLHGLFEGPAADESLRRQLEEEAAAVGSPALHERLARVDPPTAVRVHPNDLRRIVRALEVVLLTGKPLSAWQTQWRTAPVESSGGVPRCLYLDLPRDRLYERINARVLKMYDAGLVEEVRALRSLDRPLSKEASQALGYKEVFAYLDGTASLTDTIGLIQTHSRNFAKRQLTWFRNLPACRPATAELTIDLWRSRMK